MKFHWNPFKRFALLKIKILKFPVEYNDYSDMLLLFRNILSFHVTSVPSRKTWVVQYSTMAFEVLGVFYKIVKIFTLCHLLFFNQIPKRLNMLKSSILVLLWTSFFFFDSKMRNYLYEKPGFFEKVALQRVDSLENFLFFFGFLEPTQIQFHWMSLSVDEIQMGGKKTFGWVYWDMKWNEYPNR